MFKLLNAVFLYAMPVIPHTYIKNKPLPEELMTHLPFKLEIGHTGIVIAFIKGKHQIV